MLIYELFWVIISGGKWGFKCIFLWFNSAKAYMCKQATGVVLPFWYFSLWSQFVVSLMKDVSSAGSWLPSYGCCLELWGKLVGFMWFLRHRYCVEEIKVELKQIYFFFFFFFCCQEYRGGPISCAFVYWCLTQTEYCCNISFLPFYKQATYFNCFILN